MIRPLTCVCMLLAGGSGLYLYQSKHRAQMLDREIARTLKVAETARDRIGVLRGEWALLNEPERLSALSQTHLGLKTLQPQQFASLTDLAARLPAPAEITAYAAAEEPVSGPAPVAAHVAAPVVVKAVPAPPAATPAPVQQAVRPPPRPAPRPVHVATAPVVLNVAAAPIAPAPPGLSIGESVARMTRLRAAQAEGAAATPPAPTYSAPTYNARAANAPAYAAPSPSALGGRAALPPPVPYASVAR